ncbi:MAG: DUF6029 family protein [Fidelibacterota bacterium]
MRFPFYVLLISLSVLSAQKTYLSTGVTLQFGQGTRPGDKIADTTSVPYLFREHFVEVTAGYGPLSVWSNFEFSSPPQIGPRHLGVRKFRLSWRGESFSLKVGDLYGQLGRGLAVNLWENQGIDWDSSLRGIWLNINPWKKWSFDLIAGDAQGGRHILPGPGVDPRRRDFSDDARVAAVSITSQNVLRHVTAGTYLVAVESRNPWFTLTRNLVTDEYEASDSTSVTTRSLIPGFFLSHPGSDHDFYVEFMTRNHRIRNADSLLSARQGWFTYPREQWGWGGYASFSYFPGRWGVTVEYKNYFLDDSDPVKRRNLPLRLGRMSPVQNPPTVFREHSSTLLSRTPHVMDFEDEVGVQVEANVRAAPSLFLILNYAQSSRHSGFTKRIAEDFTVQWERDLTPSLGWMSSRDQFYPFQEWYGELNYHYAPLALDFRVGLSRATDVLVYDKSVIEQRGTSEWLRAHHKINVLWERRKLLSVPVEATFVLGSGWGVSVYWEHQWEDLETRNYLAFQDTRAGMIDSVTTDTRLHTPYYYRYVAMSVGKPSRFSVGWVYDSASRLRTGRIENSDPREDNWLEAIFRQAGMDLANKWLGIQGSVYLSPSTVVTVFYGSLQGGLKCDSGVCVWVPGIQDAFTVTMNSNF